MTFTNYENYEPQKTISFEEHIDYDLLKIIIANFDELYHHLGNFKDKKDHYKEIKDKRTIETLFKNRLKVKDNTFTYRTKNGGKYGRIFPNGWSLCMMNKIVRHTICSKYNYDIDIVNAHPIFLKWYCKEKNIRADYINDYCNNRENLLNKIMDDRNITRDEAKSLVLSCINDENRDWDFEPNDPMFEFYEELKRIQDFVAKDNKHLYDTCRKNNPKNPKGSCMAKFLQTMENKILFCMLDFCKLKKINVSAPQFDGFNPHKDDCDNYGRENLLTDIEDHVFKVLTIPIKLAYKDMTLGINHLLEKYEDSLSTVSSSKSDEGDKFDMIQLSDERVGKFILRHLIEDENVFYSKELETFYFYDEKTKLYIERDKDFLMTYISHIVPLLYDELNIIDISRFNKFYQGAITIKKISFENTSGQNAIVKQILSRFEDNSNFIKETFDKIPYLLPIKNNKVVDFRCDEIRERTKTDYFTKFCNIDYDPNVNIDEVKAFLRQYLIPLDKELDEDDHIHIDMFLSLLGYNITGYNNLKKIIIALGVKDTGKSTIFNNKFFVAFKEFFCMADKKVFCKTNTKAVHDQELFPLIGTRFFSTGELDEHDKLNDSFLKIVSGNDKNIPMRKCGGNKQMTGIIDAKGILPLNSLFKTTDDHTIGRLIVVDFPNVFGESKASSLPKEQLDYIKFGINDKFYSAIIKYAHFFINNNCSIKWSLQSQVFTKQATSKCNDVLDFFNTNFIITNNPKDRIERKDMLNMFKEQYGESDICRHRNKFYSQIKKQFPDNLNCLVKTKGYEYFKYIKLKNSKDEDDDNDDENLSVISDF